ncbi:MAG: hotdog domain-containing protein [Ilumatobacteraceae bacterium]
MHFQIAADKPAARSFGIDESGRPRGVIVQDRLPTLLDDEGALPVGALCVLADHTLGMLVSPRLGPDDRMVTSHMHVEVVRPLTPAVRRITGRNTEVETVPGSAFSAGRLIVGDDVLLARVSARFALVGGEQAGGTVTDAVAGVVRAGPAPDDPWTAAPIHRLLGTRVDARGDGRVRIAVVAGAHLANERAGLHGGVGAAIGERTGELALRTVVGDTHRFRAVELRIVFLRPVAAGGAELVAEAEVGHLGRTTATTTARLYRPDGKLAVQVDAVHAVRAG